jgi:hypothetical protein
MSSRVPYEIQIDASRNLMRIRYRDHVTPEDMKACLAAAVSPLAQLGPGFTLLTDLSELETMDLDCVAPLTALMDRLRAAGVRTVVRAIPDPSKDIGLKILSIIHYRRGVRIVTCESLAEAERALPAA